jgi:hypothetical protein
MIHGDVTDVTDKECKEGNGGNEMEMEGIRNPKGMGRYRRWRG